MRALHSMCAPPGAQKVHALTVALPRFWSRCDPPGAPGGSIARRLRDPEVAPPSCLIYADPSAVD